MDAAVEQQHRWQDVEEFSTSIRLRLLAAQFGARVAGRASQRAAAAAARHREAAHWHVWRTADELGGSGLLTGPEGRARYEQLLSDFAAILEAWGARWAGQDVWQSFLNKSSLTHEVEEVAVALRSLQDWLEAPSASRASRASREEAPVCVVDVCAGKGTLSMLLSYFAALRPETWGRVKQIVMLDKAVVNWTHIEAANADVRAAASGPAQAGEGSGVGPLAARVPIEAWGCCNIHDDGVIERLRTLPGQLALVGVHLCKGLSPRCISIYNVLGPEKAPFLALAPCCVPGPAKAVEVRQFEGEAERARREDLALRRGRVLNGCAVCGGAGHRSRCCPSLPGDPEERWEVLRASLAVCWRCGQAGHQKSSCGSEQSSSRPPRAAPPAAAVDVRGVLAAAAPFDAWVGALRGTVQGPPGGVELRVVPLLGQSHQGDEHNWNRERKCSWILAAR